MTRRHLHAESAVLAHHRLVCERFHRVLLRRSAHLPCSNVTSVRRYMRKVRQRTRACCVDSLLHAPLVRDRVRRANLVESLDERALLGWEDVAVHAVCEHLCHVDG